MSTVPSRMLVTSLFVAASLLPVYARGGNHFLSRAVEMTANEVRLGAMATDKSENAEVKAFAGLVVVDQNRALGKLMDLRAARTLVRTVSQGTDGFAAQTGGGTERIRRTADDIPLTPEHHRTLDHLSSLSASEFDKQFINEIMREYREVIDVFLLHTRVHGNGAVKTAAREPQDYSPEELLKDLDTVDFARETLPTLRFRLKQAEALQKRLQKR